MFNKPNSEVLDGKRERDCFSISNKQNGKVWSGMITLISGMDIGFENIV
jgi:hypothetical protein